MNLKKLGVLVLMIALCGTAAPGERLETEPDPPFALAASGRACT